MKKIICLTLFLFGIGVMPVSAQNPIPSYNVPVYHAANFQEQNKSSNANHSTLGKRVIIVNAQGAPTTKTTIYVYSLDLRDILGPFKLEGEDILYVDIDMREWGVYVESEGDLVVDVWI